MRQIIRTRNDAKKASEQQSKKNQEESFDMDVFFDKRIISISKEISPEMCESVIGQIISYNLKDKRGVKPITILINSPGGDVYSMFGIVDAIEQSASPIFTVNTGCAASAAADILIAGHRRFAFPNSTIMIHQTQYHFDDYEVISHNALMNQVKEWDRQMEQCVEYYMRKTGLSRDFILDIFSKDTYFTPQQALEHNMIDEIGFNILNIPKSPIL